jgi:hypothetical protein
VRKQVEMIMRRETERERDNVNFHLNTKQLGAKKKKKESGDTYC